MTQKNSRYIYKNSRYISRMAIASANPPRTKNSDRTDVRSESPYIIINLYANCQSGSSLYE